MWIHSAALCDLMRPLFHLQRRRRWPLWTGSIKLWRRTRTVNMFCRWIRTATTCSPLWEMGSSSGKIHLTLITILSVVAPSDTSELLKCSLLVVRWSTCLCRTPSTREPSTRRSSHPSPSRWDRKRLQIPVLSYVLPVDQQSHRVSLHPVSGLRSNRRTWTWLWTRRRPSAATWWTSELRTWRRAGSTWSWVCCGRSSRSDCSPTSSSARTKVCVREAAAS